MWILASHAALPVILEQWSPEACPRPGDADLDVVTEGQPQPGQPAIIMVSLAKHQGARGRPGTHHRVVS